MISLPASQLGPIVGNAWCQWLRPLATSWFPSLLKSIIQDISGSPSSYEPSLGVFLLIPIPCGVDGGWLRDWHFLQWPLKLENFLPWEVCSAQSLLAFRWQTGLTHRGLLGSFGYFKSECQWDSFLIPFAPFVRTFLLPDYCFAGLDYCFQFWIMDQSTLSTATQVQQVKRWGKWLNIHLQQKEERSMYVPMSKKEVWEKESISNLEEV